MVSLNVIAFVVQKILHNLVSMYKSLFANNCFSERNYEEEEITKTWS